jgi:multiple sugar transport system permease protein
MAVRAAVPAAHAAPRALRWLRWAKTGLFLAIGLMWLTPAFWALATSLKLPQDIIRPTPEWIPWPVTLQNYVAVFSASRSASMGTAALNSSIVAVLSTLFVVLTSAAAAYPLARMQFAGRDLVFGVLVGSLLVPGVIGVVPLYIVMQQLGWLNTYQALVIPEVASAFGVFLLRQFFLSLPTDLEDAARIDGANAWQIFTRILLPLSHPALVALSIFAFRASWNDFTWPLIAMTKQNMLTLPVALAALRGNYASESYGPITAGAVVSALPLLVVFVIANRRIVEGVQLTGLKG